MRKRAALNLQIAEPDAPLGRRYLQIVDAIERGIQSGRISIGQRLSTERDLAGQLGVSRTTVTTAYRELEARGILRGYVGRGTFVVGAPPKSAYCAFPLSHRSINIADGIGQFGYGLAHRSGVIPFDTGWQDSSLYPVNDLNAVLQEVARQPSPEIYLPPRPQGDPTLLEAVSQWLHSRGLRIGPESILITSGALQGLSLLARAFIEPGDVVIAEAPTFIGALMTFRWAGAEIVGVPVDDEGIRCDDLEEILIKHQPKLLYLMPTFQNPTGTVLSHKRRQRVTELSIRYRVPVVESDLYREIFFDDPPPPPLKSLDEKGLVIYQGSLSKFTCPGLRIGWLAASPDAIAALLAAKAHENLHVPALTQQVAARFLQSDHIERHLGELRVACRNRRDQFIRNLERYAPGLKFRIPGGGYYLWAEVPRPLSAADLCRAALAHDVAVREGTKLMPQGGGDERIRLTFAGAPPSEIAAGTQRLGEAIQDAVNRVTGGAPARPVARLPIV